MRGRHVAGAWVVGVMLAAVIGNAFANGNTVPSSHAGRQINATTVDDKKQKPDCNSVALTTLYLNVNGGATNDLVLGNSTAQSLNGNGGNDCVMGGGGNDTLRGGTGTDVCIGGPGTDTNGGGCETFIQ